MTDEQQWTAQSPGISFDKGRPPSGYGFPGYGTAGYGTPAYPAGPGYGPPYGYRPGPPPGLKPSNNIGWAIAAIFLFWPLCIPAFIFSSRVDSAWFAGDYAGAEKASHDARMYGLIGVCIGCALILLYVVFFVVVLSLVATG